MASSATQLLKAGVAAFAVSMAGAGAAEAQTRNDPRVVASNLRALDYDHRAEVADCNTGYFNNSDRLGRTLAAGPEVRACVAEANYDHSYGRYRIMLRAGYLREAVGQLQDAYNKRSILNRAEYESAMARCNGRQIDGFSRGNQDLGDIFRGSARNAQCTAGARADLERENSRTVAWGNSEMRSLERAAERAARPRR